MDSIFNYYNAIFNPIDLINKHSQYGQISPHPECVTNFLGIKIPIDVFPEILSGIKGTVEKPPIPANWHTDIAEFGAVFRAIDYAGPTFSIVELGCAWGCWLNNAGIGAKRLGKRIKLIGIEGDKEYVYIAKKVLILNGFNFDEFIIYNAIATDKNGYIFFPIRNDTSNFGLQPIIIDIDNLYEIDKLRKTKKYIELRSISIAEIINENGLEKIDLLHVDIQGEEFDFISKNIQDISEKVSYIVIGTHSRQIEGKLFALLYENGFALEIERPAILSYNETEIIVNDKVSVSVDGVQGWRNNKILNLKQFEELSHKQKLAFYQPINNL